jgi:aspartate aminotransferase
MAIAGKMLEYTKRASLIRKMFEEGINLKKQYGPENVFDFSLGNPNLEPPQRFKDLLVRVACSEETGLHGYMPNAGFPEARSAVADHLCREHGVKGLTAEHVIMTCGAAGAANVILKALLDPGDEVVVPTPFFVEYPYYIDNAGGVARLVGTKKDFSLDLDAMEGAVGERTKVVLINSPHNPTGKVYDEQSLRGLGELLRRKGKLYGKEIYLVADEPYRDIVYDGVAVPSILALYEHSIIATSYSKSLSLPGERIGYLAVNPLTTDVGDVLNAMVLCNRILGFVNAPAFMQRIVAHLQEVRVDVAQYRRKRDLLCDGLSSVGYEITKPEGAFYLFPRCPIADDVRFVAALRKRRILAVPGSGFSGPGHFRIAYCVDDATIINSMEGFGETLREFI